MHKSERKIIREMLYNMKIANIKNCIIKPKKYEQITMTRKEIKSYALLKREVHKRDGKLNVKKGR